MLKAAGGRRRDLDQVEQQIKDKEKEIMDLNDKITIEAKNQKAGSQRRVVEMADLRKELQRIRESANPRV